MPLYCPLHGEKLTDEKEISRDKLCRIMIARCENKENPHDVYIEDRQSAYQEGEITIILT